MESRRETVLGLIPVRRLTSFVPASPLHLEKRVEHAHGALHGLEPALGGSSRRRHAPLAVSAGEMPRLRPMATLTSTPFDAVQREIPGAEFAEWEGWHWIAGFGDPVREHHAVRRACGVWDESPLQKWEVSGPGALVAADRFFTNDMRSLQVGQLRYGAFCDDGGRMLGDGIAFRLADDRLRLVTALESDGEAFAVAAGDAEYDLRQVTAELPHLQVQGPHSRDVIQSLTTADVSALGYYRFAPEPVDVAGVPVLLARCGYSGELGYELYCAAEPPSGCGRRWPPPAGSPRTA